VLVYAPPPPARLAANAPERNLQTGLKLDVYKSPFDATSYQHGNYSDPQGPAGIGLSSYDDVGTSYHFNVKWWDQVYPRLPFDRAFNFGCDRLRLSDAFQPSRMVWIHDQTSDVVANNPNVNFKLKNSNTCGDYNKSIMGFMDGHVAYLKVRAGNIYPTSYKNEFYSFVFEDLRFPN